MKSIYIVLALLMVIAGITIFILTSPVPDGATGTPSIDISGIAQGGDGAAKLQAIGKAPYYFQCAVILLAGVLLYMGIAPHRRDRFLTVCFAAGTGFALFVWFMLYSGYQDYLLTGDTEIMLGFPVPTNWMFWGVWGSFAAFDLFYVIFFRRYFLPAEDEAAFEALVKEMKQDGGRD